MGGHARKYKDGFKKNHELQDDRDRTNINKQLAEEELEDG